MAYPDDRSLDEFSWECEFRREDSRINAYLAELPRFIDLPDEDGILIRQMTRNPELHRDVVGWDAWGMSLDMDPDEDFIFPADWQDREAAEIFKRLQPVAVEWCRLFASRLEGGESLTAGIRAVCLYGQLLSLTTDIIDLKPGEMPELKIALLKRFHAGINSLCGIMHGIVSEQSSMLIPCRSQLSRLQALRKQAVDLLTKIRHGQHS